MCAETILVIGTADNWNLCWAWHSMTSHIQLENTNFAWSRLQTVCQDVRTAIESGRDYKSEFRYLYDTPEWSWCTPYPNSNTSDWTACVYPNTSIQILICIRIWSSAELIWFISQSHIAPYINILWNQAKNIFVSGNLTPWNAEQIYFFSKWINQNWDWGRSLGTGWVFQKRSHWVYHGKTRGHCKGTKKGGHWVLNRSKKGLLTGTWCVHYIGVPPSPWNFPKRFAS